ncbi:PTS sugar transporter subunit IIA [Gordonia sinesedis]
MVDITELLRPEAIELDVTVPDWRGAIRTAGSLLERTGIADAAYTDAMIESVEEKGPYIVIAPGFAFAHARPSEAVHTTGMSWVRLAEPVEFGHATNDPVSLVVALAAVDASAHTSAMAQLAKSVGSPQRRAELDAARTPEQILAILRGDGASSTGATGATGATGGSPVSTGANAASTEGATLSATAATPAATGAAAAGGESGGDAGAYDYSGDRASKGHILTVCGNGLGTSLFLKNTLEQVLDKWGWTPYMSVEATDTISAKGKAKEADLILTSGEIARTLGDVGIPVKVIENFTSTAEVDAAMRSTYDV